MLANNEANRRIRPTIVHRYASDMAAGKWNVGGSTIDIDVDGHLANGQHRLRACIKAGVSFECVVVRGLPGNSQETMDTGVRRTLPDLLTWRGERNTTTLASVVNLSWKWREERLSSPIWPTHREALEWLDHNPSVRDAVRRTNGIRQDLMCPGSALSAFAHQTGRIDYEESDSFLKHLKEGCEMGARDPILVLRNWMVNQIARKSGGTKPIAMVYLALLIKAWNAWIEGREIQQISWKRGGSLREDFPTLVDPNGNPFRIADEL